MRVSRATASRSRGVNSNGSGKAWPPAKDDSLRAGCAAVATTDGDGNTEDDDNWPDGIYEETT